MYLSRGVLLLTNVRLGPCTVHIVPLLVVRLLQVNAVVALRDPVVPSVGR